METIGILQLYVNGWWWRLLLLVCATMLVMWLALHAIALCHTARLDPCEFENNRVSRTLCVFWLMYVQCEHFFCSSSILMRRAIELQHCCTNSLDAVDLVLVFHWPNFTNMQSLDKCNALNDFFFIRYSYCKRKLQFNSRSHQAAYALHPDLVWWSKMRLTWKPYGLASNQKHLIDFTIQNHPTCESIKYDTKILNFVNLCEWICVFNRFWDEYKRKYKCKLHKWRSRSI